MQASEQYHVPASYDQTIEDAYKTPEAAFVEPERVGETAARLLAIGDRLEEVRLDEARDAA